MKRDNDNTVVLALNRISALVSVFSWKMPYATYYLSIYLDKQQ